MSLKSAPSFRMKKESGAVVACLLFSVLSLAARQEQTFKGEITDSMCAGPAGHAAMLKKGETTAHCTIACVKRGAKYVLSNAGNKTVYELDNRKKAKDFAGQNVVVIGTLDKATGTIHVFDMVRALSPKVTQAKTIFIYCDACPRGMAAAKRAAFQEMMNWGRFSVLQDWKKADLIFLFSANPYLGDFGIRDGPDARPMSVDITYMNVIDPGTGVSLWGDSRRWGSWFVAKATEDLILEFREQWEAEEGRAFLKPNLRRWPF